MGLLILNIYNVFLLLKEINDVNIRQLQKALAVCSRENSSHFLNSFKTQQKLNENTVDRVQKTYFLKENTWKLPFSIIKIYSTS